MKLRHLGWSLILLFFAGALWAQQDTGDQPGASDVDPPTRAARLSYVEGAVSVQPAGIDDWTAASINRPLTGGDQLWSDRGSRAEIQFDTATVSIADSTSLAPSRARRRAIARPIPRLAPVTIATLFCMATVRLSGRATVCSLALMY